MYKVEWDKETGGVILNNRITDQTLGIAPRPVFFEELDLLGLDKLGWVYPHCEEPLMWAINKQYYYQGEKLFEAKGANIYTMPTLEFGRGIEPMPLKPVDMAGMLAKTADIMFVLENEAIEFIRDTYTVYVKVNKAYEKADANKMDFETLAQRAEKRIRQKMAVVKQDCDSFDIMPLDDAEAAGKKVVLSTKIDRFIASFSGGKDSQVVLDLCTRAIPPTEFEVIYSDTGYELPPSLELYKDVEQYYHQKFPALKFSMARNHESVLNYWDKIGTPSDNHRWCCSVMKTAPLYRMLKVEENKQAKVLVFDGVRAEESMRRESYQRIGKGKHTFVYNAHPILAWNSTEIFLYIFRHNLQINYAYRVGKARVGCLICPFSTSWDDMVINRVYGQELKPFVDRLKTYSSQVKILNFDNFLSERRWKLKPLGDRSQIIPKVEFKSSMSSHDFIAEIKDSRQSILSWLPALCPYTIREVEGGFVGELHFKKSIYPYEISIRDTETCFKVHGNPENELVYLLRRLIYKTAYCINCEVCEVDCPTGALSIVPNVKIDNNKCIHCHKCFNTHDRGCVAADCARMIIDTEKKLGAKIQGYKTFGLREEWIDEYFIDPAEFWKENSLGTAQVDAVKAWLRDAEITDVKNNITPLGAILKTIYQDNPLLFWEVAYINMSYNSFIVNWVCANINAGQLYNKKLIKEEIGNQGYTGSLSTVENAASAYIDLVKRSPIGESLRQGIVQGKDGFVKEAYDDLSLEAIAYSIYKYAQKSGFTMMRVSDFYKSEEICGVYKEFRISKDSLIKKLRSLSSANNRVLIAELNMGLDHITLRDDLDPLKVLEMLAL